MSTRPIAISVGDISGIGLEVTLKALSESNSYQDCCPVIYARPELIKLCAAGIGLSTDHIQSFESWDELRNGQVYVKSCWDEPLDYSPGKASAQSGRLALRSLDDSLDDLLAKRCQALVTAPIDKLNIQQEGFDFPGHTEYLAARSGQAEVLMLLVSEQLRVGVVTGHIPIAAVAQSISAELIGQKIRIIQRSLKQDFGLSQGRIAVLGLNPHAGDGGLLGHEEIDIIAPAIATARAEGLNVSGPYPADGLFGSGKREQFDAILAMYHDQGLAPFKALSFGRGVNCTVGLPIVRTSPDHGTAYDIAGQNKADGRSMRAALRTAVDIVQSRQSNGVIVR